MTNDVNFNYAASIWATAGAMANADDFDISSSNAVNSLYKTYTRVLGTKPVIQFLNAGRIPLPVSASAQTAQTFATGTSVYVEALSTGTLGANCDWLSQLGGNSVTLNPILKIQKNAGRIGSNLMIASTHARARFGLIGNEQHNTTGPDSAVGIGLNLDYLSWWISSGWIDAADSTCGGGINNNGSAKSMLWLR